MFKMIEGPQLPLYARYTIATVMVVWFSLAGGSWLGRMLIANEVFGEKEDQVEFRSMPEARARPWVKVDPELEKELEALRASAGPSLVESLTGKEKPTRAPNVTATPAIGRVHPPSGGYLLQFGAFTEKSNAERLAAQLRTQDQIAKIEEVDSSTGPLYLVKGQVFEKAEEAERVARSLRTQSFQVFVVGE